MDLSGWVGVLVAVLGVMAASALLIGFMIGVLAPRDSTKEQLPRGRVAKGVSPAGPREAVAPNPDQKSELGR